MNIDFSLIDLILVAPMICLFFGSIIPITIKVLRGNRETNPGSMALYALMSLISALCFLLSTQSMDTFALSKALVFDGMSNFISFLVIGITGLTLFYSKEHPSVPKEQFSEYIFLLLNSAIGMLIVAAANDLIVLFIGIEIMSLCLYLLIAMSNETRLSKEAAFKYFILGSFSSAIFLYGIAFIYGSVGSTYMDDVAQVASISMSSQRLFVFGAVMIIVGFGFKVALAPFHAWAPDVYQGSPTPITGFMATGVKAVIFMSFLRWLSTDILTGDRSIIFVNVLEWLAVLTMLVGNIAAIMQNNLKRMLAYSGIAHSGYLLVGLLAATVGGEVFWGASSLFFYLLAYSIMTLGAFGVISLFEDREDRALDVDNLKGLSTSHPWLALSITLLMLSLAGLPPTLGFFGKFLIFSAAIKQGFFWLAIWGVINSVISVYYYLRPVVLMYMKESDDSCLKVISRPITRAFVGLSAILIMVLSLAVEPIYQYILKVIG